MTDAVYTQLDERRVLVTGSRFEDHAYTMKLEGAGRGPYQTVSLLGIEEPDVLASLDLFHDRLKATLIERIASTFGAEAGEYDVSLRIYGWNAVSGRPMPADAAVPHEVGVLLVVTAATQAEIERGPVYRFWLNHIVEAADGLELVRTRFIDVAAVKELADA